MWDYYQIALRMAHEMTAFSQLASMKICCVNCSNLNCMFRIFIFFSDDIFVYYYSLFCQFRRKKLTSPRWTFFGWIIWRQTFSSGAVTKNGCDKSQVFKFVAQISKELKMLFCGTAERKNKKNTENKQETKVKSIERETNWACQVCEPTLETNYKTENRSKLFNIVMAWHCVALSCSIVSWNALKIIHVSSAYYIFFVVVATWYAILCVQFYIWAGICHILLRY